MTLRRQLLLLLLVHLIVALAAWDGYRIGLKRGRAEILTPQTRIEIEQTPKSVAPPKDCPDCSCVEQNSMILCSYPVYLERWDANWRLN